MKFKKTTMKYAKSISCDLTNLAEVKRLPRVREINAAEKKLVAALRSGKYKQTKEQLKRNNSYCCLGVACKISGRGKFYHDAFGTMIERSAVSLTNNVREQLGWDSYYGELIVGITTKLSVRDNDVFRRLDELNDSGVKFPIIAELINKGYVRAESKKKKPKSK